MFRIAVREECDREKVGLRRARGQSGGGAGALNVEDHARNLGVIAESGKLGHERDAGSGGGGHRARASPASAEHHADRGELIFSLNNREGGLAIRLDAIASSCSRSALSTSDDDGVIGYQATTVTPANIAPRAAAAVAVDDDLALASRPSRSMKKGSFLTRLAAA